MHLIIHLYIGEFKCYFTHYSWFKPRMMLFILKQTARCNCEVTPTSSLDVKGRIRESSCCNFKTSRGLLKVLNRIQSIKEQHASNISVVNDLKVELDLSRAQIKELKREKQMNIWQIKSLTKQTAEKKFVRRNNANDRLKIAVQSVEEELEGETRSRRHSESLHCRLALELSEVKSLFYGSLRALERERKARILLENLCDEFAIGIKDYKQEMKEAKSGDDLVEINSVVDKLGFDIETFLRAKGSVNLRKYGNSYPEELVREVYPCQYYSLDSFPLKDQSIGAPVNVHDDDNAKNFGSASGEGYGNIRSIDQEKKGGQISTRKQVQTKQIKSSLSHDENQRRFVERNSSDRTSLINETEVSTVWEEPAQVAQESDGPLIRRLNSSDRKSFLPTGGENICRGAHCVHSVVRSNVSPVKRQRKLQFSKVMGQSQEGTLMAKLLEARSDVRKSGSEASTSCLG
ncbi:uncharacterized protein LOC129295758 isoform X1 [Prosopis cineraria]|uniref:uncharacterized protein LOC129295758 isoform X1 n=1 Tax=Prosopis cineraria TaxID=364024 RepID=UPI00241065BF|nr:uncharacterized protein LOC129295758 isoform X1 [Prosopis cineraria]